jgi:hypothetical protein
MYGVHRSFVQIQQVQKHAALAHVSAATTESFMGTLRFAHPTLAAGIILR